MRNAERRFKMERKVIVKQKKTWTERIEDIKDFFWNLDYWFGQLSPPTAIMLMRPVVFGIFAVICFGIAALFGISPSEFIAMGLKGHCLCGC
jgi:hypothetical protein